MADADRMVDKYRATGIFPQEIDLNRPKIQNPDGSFSTERTITLEVDKGRHILLPTIVDGKQRSIKEAIQMWREGTNKHVGEYPSAEAADAAAVARSQQIGKLRGDEDAQ